jgi:mannose-6-phosphate isomerase-like protein (cupin superfamily)
MTESEKSSPPAIPPVGHAGLTPDEYAPDGSEIRFVVRSAEGATRTSVVEATLPAGQVARPLRHQSIEEVWYCLSGSGHVWRCPPEADPASVAPVDFRAGDGLVIPTGWYFQFRAGPDAPLRFLCLTCPPWPGDQEAVPSPVSMFSTL